MYFHWLSLFGVIYLSLSVPFSIKCFLSPHLFFVFIFNHFLLICSCVYSVDPLYFSFFISFSLFSPIFFYIPFFSFFCVLSSSVLSLFLPYFFTFSFLYFLPLSLFILFYLIHLILFFCMFRCPFISFFISFCILPVYISLFLPLYSLFPLLRKVKNHISFCLYSNNHYFQPRKPALACTLRLYPFKRGSFAVFASLHP